MLRTVVPAVAVLLLASSARAEPELRSGLDGTYLTLGPVTGAVRVDSGWTSAVGLQVSALRVAEGRLPAVIGLSAGGVRVGGREGGRMWLEVVAGMRSPLPLPVGFSLGATADLEDVSRPRPGMQATIWIFTGIVPYLRAGQVAGRGSFLEAGVQILLPAVRFL